MKVVCIVEARMGSTRLPEKTMADICGKPVLQRVIERLSLAERVDEICIATTTKENDDVICEKCTEWNVATFRGSEGDVLDRVLKAARFMDATLIVRAGADNVFVDPFVIDKMIEIYNTGHYDLVGNNLKLTFPVGISGHVLSTELLKTIEPLAKSERDRDDVDRYIWERPEQFRVYNFEAKPEERISTLRVTLDYPEDLELVRILYCEVALNNPGFSTADIVSYVKKNPHLAIINAKCVQKSAPWVK